MRNHKEIVVCALYRFVVLDDCQELQSQLMNKMKDNGVRGTLLFAHEGINGTIAGSREGIDAVIGFLKADNRFAGIRCRETFTNQMPFQRTRVKLKKEIVTMAVQDIDPNQLKGTYVKSGEWSRYSLMKIWTRNPTVRSPCSVPVASAVRNLPPI